LFSQIKEFQIFSRQIARNHGPCPWMILPGETFRCRAPMHDAAADDM